MPIRHPIKLSSRQVQAREKKFHKLAFKPWQLDEMAREDESAREVSPGNMQNCANEEKVANMTTEGIQKEEKSGSMDLPFIPS